MIRDGARSEWEFADWDVYPDEINGYGESSLYAGEGEDEFAERLTHAIWQANGAHCSVKVTCTFLGERTFRNPPVQRAGLRNLFEGGREWVRNGTWRWSVNTHMR